MGDFKTNFQIDDISFWQQRCSDFWNLFYSYLILNQYNINILNLNYGIPQITEDIKPQKGKIYYVLSDGKYNKAVLVGDPAEFIEKDKPYYEINFSFVDNINLINYIETEDAEPQAGKMYYVLSDGKYNEANLGDPAEFKAEDKPYYEIDPIHYIKTKDDEPQIGKIYYVLSDGKYNKVEDLAEFEEDKQYYEFNFNNNIINLLLQKQQFEINNQYYEIPQNFLGIEFKETESMIKILFYYFDENKQEEDIEELESKYKNYFNPFNIDISSGGES